MKYSIWLIPPEPLYGRLKSIINELSKEYKSPQFEPHTTLLGDIDIELSLMEEKVRKLAGKIDKLDLSTGVISYSTTYFQSIFVRLDSTAKLMQLNLDAKEIFHRDNNVFMPHISLLYGNHDMATREKIASKIQLPKTSFTANTFVITPSTVNPSDWIHSATIPFGLNSG